MTTQTLKDHMVEVLLEWGWRQTSSGRFVHPDLAPLDGSRRRLYTIGEAMTITTAAIDEAKNQCEDCGSTECHPED